MKSPEYIDNVDSDSNSSSAMTVSNQEDEKQRLREQYYGNKILQLVDFNQAFELVKLAVEDKFKMHRAGLKLDTSRTTDQAWSISYSGFQPNHSEQKNLKYNKNSQISQ